ncbi:hypothetical protein Gogos_001301 [Gossypium gossypioides]|uniref:Uncharacterized protein n=1 Tax=Gossypium gossypioides TaxID=34282 RepID=A0A7J9CVU3_GOSGO|nr:hypothetical protein [Gossypium gossypioides]
MIGFDYISNSNRGMLMIVTPLKSYKNIKFLNHLFNVILFKRFKLLGGFNFSFLDNPIGFCLLNWQQWSFFNYTNNSLSIVCPCNNAIVAVNMWSWRLVLCPLPLLLFGHFK